MTTPIHQLKSGGFLVDFGDDFPIWRPDMGAVRRLLLVRELQAKAADVLRRNDEVNS